MPGSPSTRSFASSFQGLEKQCLQLQHVRLVVGQGECKLKASLAQELVLLELVPKVSHAHQLQVGILLGKRQRVDARALGGLCCALCALLGELGRARLLLHQARCCAPLQHSQLQALPHPLAQQLPHLLTVCALAHQGRCAVGVAKDYARTHVVMVPLSTDVVRAPKSKEALRAPARYRHAIQALAQLRGDLLRSAWRMA
eukprot:6198569-Pleurochrysis_carterae.AAC.1